MMFDRIKRDGDTTPQTQFARPDACRDHHVFGLNSALSGDHAADSTLALFDIQHPHSLANLCASASRALG